MKSFLISDNRDTLLGLRLAGIMGMYIRDDKCIKDAFMKAIKEEYGILFITEKIYKNIKNEVIQHKEKKILPLITIIPDRHGNFDETGKIASYIRESIGV